MLRTNTGDRACLNPSREKYHRIVSIIRHLYRFVHAESIDQTSWQSLRLVAIPNAPILVVITSATSAYGGITRSRCHSGEIASSRLIGYASATTLDVRDATIGSSSIAKSCGNKEILHVVYKSHCFALNSASSSQTGCANR